MFDIMKILSINKFYWRKGGSEAVFFNEKELLESNNHQVVPFSMRSEKNEPSKFDKFFVNEVDYDATGIASKIKSAATVLYSLEAKKKMSAILQEFKPDIAHFHIFQHQISPSVFGPLRKVNIPLVLTLHDLKPICPNYKMYTNDHICEECKNKKFYKCFSNKCNKGSTAKSLVSTMEMYLHYALGYYQKVDRYIAVSKFYQQKMIEFGFPEEQISYIPNYIDVAAYKLSKNDGGYALSFGRLSEEKGVEILVEAARLCPNIPIIIAGSGPAESKLKQLAVDKNLKNISFVGFKTGEELQNLISNASFTIITSKWYENCPMSILESLAVGKPVIGANIGGIPELINNEVDGLIFEVGSPVDLATKMNFLWLANKNRIEMGIEGRKKIERNFNPKQHYEQLISLYTELIR